MSYLSARLAVSGGLRQGKKLKGRMGIDRFAEATETRSAVAPLLDAVHAIAPVAQQGGKGRTARRAAVTAAAVMATAAVATAAYAWWRKHEHEHGRPQVEAVPWTPDATSSNGIPEQMAAAPGVEARDAGEAAMEAEPATGIEATPAPPPPETATPAKAVLVHPGGVEPGVDRVESTARLARDAGSLSPSDVGASHPSPAPIIVSRSRPPERRTTPRPSFQPPREQFAVPSQRPKLPNGRNSLP